jgi:hypothetical protein
MGLFDAVGKVFEKFGLEKYYKVWNKCLAILLL